MELTLQNITIFWPDGHLEYEALRTRSEGGIPVLEYYYCSDQRPVRGVYTPLHIAV